MPDLHTLLLNWQSIDAEVHGLEIERHALESDIADAMTENQAEFATVTGVEATLKPVLEYRKELDGPFQQVAEELSPEELDACLTAPKPAPARSFDVRKMKQHAKKGGVFKSALDAATLSLPPRLKIRSVE
jgi:hypothetical protein